MTIPAREWGKLMAGLNDETFKRRLAGQDDPERIRAALKHEDERPYETRPERIAALNKRLQDVAE